MGRTVAGLHLWLRDGAQVDLGPAEKLRAKGLSLEAVLKYYAGQHVTATYVDVSLPDRPLAKPKLAP